MTQDDIEELRQLRRQYEPLAAPPGLIHAMRVRFDGQPCEPDRLSEGWEEFLPDHRPSGFHVCETRTGVGMQQGCYFGAVEKLDNYTSLVARALGHFPPDYLPITHHHRDAAVDRNQWSLSLYGMVPRLEWTVSVNASGSGVYSQLEIDPTDAAWIASEMHSRGEMRRFIAEIGETLLREGKSPPEYLYASLSIDLIDMSLRVFDLHVQDILRGRYRPAPGVVTNDALSLAAMPGQSGAPADTDKWPPDDGWHFRPAEFAFSGRVEKLTGVKWRLLKLLAEKNRAVRAGTMREVVWPENRVEISTIRSTLSDLRKILRETFRLPQDVDPIPSVDRGDNRAWRLDRECIQQGVPTAD